MIARRKISRSKYNPDFSDKEKQLYDSIYYPKDKQEEIVSKEDTISWTASPYHMVHDIDEKIRLNAWVIKRFVDRYNQKHKTHWTPSDYSKYAEKVHYSVGVTRTKKKDKTIVLPISDTHIGKLCKIPQFDDDGITFTKEETIYDVEHFMQSHLRYRQAIEALVHDFDLRSTVDTVQIISLGDLIDGDGRIYKTQPFNLEPALDTPQMQKRFCLKEFLIPYMEWLKAVFATKDVRMFMCAGNHESPGYDISDFNNETYQMANHLQEKGYTVSCREHKQWYGLVDVKGWGFLCTHGHGIRLGHARPTIERNLMTTKFEIPKWQFYLEGHWHNSKFSGQYIQGKGKDSIHYYRSSTTVPVGADRHSSKFRSGDNTWWMLTIDEQQGLIDERTFDMSKVTFGG